jgi:hypothetical protein
VTTAFFGAGTSYDERENCIVKKKLNERILKNGRSKK